MGDFAFIDAVEDYIYMEDDFSERIMDWARSHCSTFIDKDPRSIEQPLEHTQLHEEYAQLFESLLEKFLDENNLTVREFYTSLSEQYELADSKQCNLPVSATFASTLLTFTDFFSFCEMMYEINNGGEAIFCPPLLEVSNNSNDKRTDGLLHAFSDSKSSPDSPERESDCKYDSKADSDAK